MNDYANGTCDITIKTSVRDVRRFNQRETIKVSERRYLPDYVKNGVDNLSRFVPYVEETAYKVLKCEYGDEVGTQIVTIDGLIDAQRASVNDSEKALYTNSFVNNTIENVFISKAHKNTVQYITTLTEDAYESNDGMTYMNLYAGDNIFNYVDCNFSFITSEFNPDNAFSHWSSYTEVDGNMYYLYDIPITVS